MPPSERDSSLDFSSLRARFDSGALTPSALVEELAEAWRASTKKHVWIHLCSTEELLAAAKELEYRKRNGEALPLYGLPFAVKDNIDVAGLPTTAACPGYLRVATESAFVVARLLAAGALCVGKTNLDQFATGLVGVRSPYGVPENPFDATRIPGGSSSGSAVAVAAGLVSFALGTDTAGSGRIPAAFNNIVGLKPTRGLLSTSGVVPACRSLDCVSVFALTVRDAAEVAEIAAGYDERDAYSRRDARKVRFAPSERPRAFRFGLPNNQYLNELDFGGTRRDFERAVTRLKRLGGEAIEIDFEPFANAGQLLYGGAWVAERGASVRDILSQNPSGVLPVISEILGGAERFTAVDAFASLHTLAEYARRARRAFEDMDVLVVPTAPFFPTIGEVEADPIGLNSRLGALMNFANLLDLSALALPSDLRADGLPFGVTLFGPRDADSRLAALGAAFHADVARTLGATLATLPAEPAPPITPKSEMRLAVVGAHLTGQPLNKQLTELGATLVRACKTAPEYRLYALANTTPPKPGLARANSGGAAIDVEVWQLTPEGFGTFMKGVPAPMCIGTVTLEDSERVHGFLCEPIALEGATEITQYGGWRAYLASKASSG
ncbi:MAG TPA: allophanate hydrolase [Polyangiaceae bacterium]|jgi:allophanate hydrolase|nr:allophanate hydrolase [Polyangiaceae bacterium]